MWVEKDSSQTNASKEDPSTDKQKRNFLAALTSFRPRFSQGIHPARKFQARGNQFRGARLLVFPKNCVLSLFVSYENIGPMSVGMGKERQWTWARRHPLCGVGLYHDGVLLQDGLAVGALRVVLAALALAVVLEGEGARCCSGRRPPPPAPKPGRVQVHVDTLHYGRAPFAVTATGRYSVRTCCFQTLSNSKQFCSGLEKWISLPLTAY